MSDKERLHQTVERIALSGEYGWEISRIQMISVQLCRFIWPRLNASQQHCVEIAEKLLAGELDEQQRDCAFDEAWGHIDLRRTGSVDDAISRLPLFTLSMPEFPGEVVDWLIHYSGLAGIPDGVLADLFVKHFPTPKP